MDYFSSDSAVQSNMIPTGSCDCVNLNSQSEITSLLKSVSCTDHIWNAWCPCGASDCSHHQWPSQNKHFHLHRGSAGQHGVCLVPHTCSACSCTWSASPRTFCLHDFLSLQKDVYPSLNDFHFSRASVLDVVCRQCSFLIIPGVLPILNTYSSVSSRAVTKYTPTTPLWWWGSVPWF